MMTKIWFIHRVHNNKSANVLKLIQYILFNIRLHFLMNDVTKHFYLLRNDVTKYSFLLRKYTRLSKRVLNDFFSYSSDVTRLDSEHRFLQLVRWSTGTHVLTSGRSRCLETAVYDVPCCILYYISFCEIIFLY